MERKIPNFDWSMFRNETRKTNIARNEMSREDATKNVSSALHQRHLSNVSDGRLAIFGLKGRGYDLIYKDLHSLGRLPSSIKH